MVENSGDSRVSQLLDQEVVEFLRNKDSRTPVNNNKIKVYYKNQMSASYKLDERIIKNIVRNNTL